jgi:hypothetical protein
MFYWKNEVSGSGKNGSFSVGAAARMKVLVRCCGDQ